MHCTWPVWPLDVTKTQHLTSKQISSNSIFETSTQTWSTTEKLHADRWRHMWGHWLSLRLWAGHLHVLLSWGESWICLLPSKCSSVLVWRSSTETQSVGRDVDRSWANLRRDSDCPSDWCKCECQSLRPEEEEHHHHRHHQSHQCHCSRVEEFVSHSLEEKILQTKKISVV